jgi:hypothetical protein
LDDFRRGRIDKKDWKKNIRMRTMRRELSE